MRYVVRALVVVLTFGGLCAVLPGSAFAAGEPAVRVGDVAVWEGDSGTLTVSVPVDLSNVYAGTVTMNYAVRAGTATAGSEFLAKSGKLTFKAGVTTKKVTVKVLADVIEEDDESVEVVVSAPQNATLDDDLGVLTLRDDDAPGSGSGLEAAIGDVVVTESDGGKHIVQIPVTLSAPAPQEIRLYVTSSCASDGGSADYSGPTKTRTLRYLFGQRQKFVQFVVLGDFIQEDLEAVVRSLSVAFGPVTIRDPEGDVTIIDDDGYENQEVGSTTRVSITDDEMEAEASASTLCGSTHGSLLYDISADGSTVLFSSGAHNLVPNDPNTFGGLFVRDRTAQSTESVSVDSNGAQIGSTGDAALSADGRHVLFATDALTANHHLYVHDRVTGNTELVSLNAAGNPVAGGAYAGDISGDGRYVVFRTATDHYLRDRVAGTTQLIASAQSLFETPPHITPDGRYVSFVSPSSTLVPNDTNNFPDVFIRDLVTGATERINIAPDGSQETSYRTNPINGSDATMSADGRYVFFLSSTSSIEPSEPHVYLRDRLLQTTERVDVDVTCPSNNPLDVGRQPSSISTDGRYVAFGVLCELASGNETPSSFDGVYLRDRVSATTTRLDVAEDGTPSNGTSPRSRISDDGRYVAFHSTADNLVPDDTNEISDVFVIRTS